MQSDFEKLVEAQGKLSHIENLIWLESDNTNRDSLGHLTREELITIIDEIYRKITGENL